LAFRLTHAESFAAWGMQRGIAKDVMSDLSVGADRILTHLAGLNPELEWKPAACVPAR
jgi:hypothetical protein